MMGGCYYYEGGTAFGRQGMGILIGIGRWV